MTSNILSSWTIVFDLDGTLVDTAPDLHLALNHCLREGGHAEVAFESVRHMIGQGAKAMIEKGLAHQGATLDEASIDALWRSFLTYYEANICERSAPFAGMLDTLDTLEEHGARLAVCTNKTQALAQTLIAALGLTDRFQSICGADAVPEKKPSGDHIIETIRRAGGNPSRAIMIGDSQTDEKAARNAGLPFVFVTFGYGPSPDLADESIYRISSYSQMEETVLSIATD